MKNLTIFSTNPIIYTLDDFIDKSILEDLLFTKSKFKKGETRINNLNNLRKSYVSSIDNCNSSKEQIYKNIKNKLHFKLSKIEDLQIQKYEENCFYKPHFDVDTSQIKLNNINLDQQRRFSIIIYLNEDYEGGETHFSNLNINIKPKSLRVLVFENCIRQTNFPNPLSLHEGKEVIKGTKLIINTWSYESNYLNSFKLKIDPNR